MLSNPTWTGPILDNHFHLNREGRFLDAARDFKNVGGTDIVLVHCPNFASPPTDKQGHIDTYADTVRMADDVRQHVGLGVRVVLGPHPAAFAHQFSAWLEESGEKVLKRRWKIIATVLMPLSNLFMKVKPTQ
jgi:TatD-related deoxyribonuclease